MLQCGTHLLCGVCHQLTARLHLPQGDALRLELVQVIILARDTLAFVALVYLVCSRLHCFADGLLQAAGVAYDRQNKSSKFGREA